MIRVTFEISNENPKARKAIYEFINSMYGESQLETAIHELLQGQNIKESAVFLESVKEISKNE